MFQNGRVDEIEKFWQVQWWEGNCSVICSAEPPVAGLVKAFAVGAERKQPAAPATTDHMNSLV